MSYLKIFFLFSVMMVTLSCLSADEDPITIPPMAGSEVNVPVGGPTEPNQVWIDLSDYTHYSINKRTDWDLGFYTGNEFRVIMNGSLVMTAIKVPNVAADIDKIKDADVRSLKNIAQVGTFDAANMQYVDNPDGNFITQTSGIGAIKENDADNPIYLINLGKEIPSKANISAGSVSLSGDPRGWKKNQVLRAKNGYKICYGDLNATGKKIKEYIISKDTEYNFIFFNLRTGSPVKI